MSKRAQRLSVEMVVLTLLAFIFVMGTPSKLSSGPLAPPPAAALSLDPCKLIPEPLARHLCEVGKKAATGSLPIPNPVSIIPGAIGDAAQSGINSAVTWLTDQFATGVLWVLKQEYTFVNDSTTPKVNQPWFVGGLYGLVFGMGVYVALAALVFESGAAVQERNPRRAGDALIKFAVFWIVGLSLPLIVGSVVYVCDHYFAPLWMQYAGAHAKVDIHNMSKSITKELSSTSAGAGLPIVMPFIFGIIGVLGGVAMEALLIVRDGVLYLLTAAEIVVLGLWVSERLSGEALQRTTLMLGAWIGFKVFTSFILVVGLLMLGAGDGFSQMMVGAVICCLTPYFAYKTLKWIARHDMSAAATFQNSAALFQSAKALFV
jgi:hypothetical protein